MDRKDAQRMQEHQQKLDTLDSEFSALKTALVQGETETGDIKAEMDRLRDSARSLGLALRDLKTGIDQLSGHPDPATSGPDAPPLDGVSAQTLTETPDQNGVASDGELTTPTQTLSVGPGFDTTQDVTHPATALGPASPSPSMHSLILAHPEPSGPTGVHVTTGITSLPVDGPVAPTSEARFAVSESTVDRNAHGNDPSQQTQSLTTHELVGSMDEAPIAVESTSVQWISSTGHATSGRWPSQPHELTTDIPWVDARDPAWSGRSRAPAPSDLDLNREIPRQRALQQAMGETQGLLNQFVRRVSVLEAENRQFQSNLRRLNQGAVEHQPSALNFGVSL